MRQLNYHDGRLASMLLDWVQHLPWVQPLFDVLVIDEADELLNIEPGILGTQGDGIKKSMLNNFLDGCKARMIFISNASSQIPDSVLRRLPMHIGFEDLNQHQRLKIWNALCTGTEPFPKKERQQLASRYMADPSRIH